MNIYSTQTLDPIFDSLKDFIEDDINTEPLPDLPPWNAGVTGYTTKPCSEETKRKISEAKKGKTPWNKGIPITEEQRIKNRQAATGKKHSEEHNKKIANSLIGKKHSEETKRKMSESMKKARAK